MSSITTLNKLRGIDHAVDNGNIIIYLYPCSCCDDVMIWLAYSGHEQPLLNMSLTNYRDVKMATSVFNYMNEFDVPMTPTNFLDLLTEIFVKKDLAV